MCDSKEHRTKVERAECSIDANVDRVDGLPTADSLRANIRYQIETLELTPAEVRKIEADFGFPLGLEAGRAAVDVLSVLAMIVFAVVFVLPALQMAIADILAAIQRAGQ